MDLVIIANAWSAAQDNPTSKHQLARELVRAGHRVLWVEGAGMRRPSLGSGRDRGRVWRKVKAALRGARRAPQAELETGEAPVAGTHGELWVLAPLLVPLPGIAAVRAFNGWLFRLVALAWSRRLGFRDPVLVNYVPVLAGAMRGWGRPGGVRRVYHCVDRWDRFDMYDSAVMTEMDRQCRANADLVIASSMDLEAHCRQDHAHVHRVNHGVNHAHFARALDPRGQPRPPDLPLGPTVGFVGLLSEWVDQDLILAVARALPADGQVVLIGTADVAIDRLRAEGNIRVLGPRPFASLPSYVAHFDVGIIPFAVSELTRAVNPIKLREMLAAGCPVVSTALPEVASYARPDGVFVADTHAAFVAQVRAWVDRPLDMGARRALSASMLSETWGAKAEEIVTLIKQGGGHG